MSRFEIFTEDHENLEVLAGLYLEGFTIFRGVGCWRGNTEEAAQIIVWTEDEQAIYTLARAIKKHNEQEAVLVLRTEAIGQII